MLLSRSLRRKVLATAMAGVFFTLVYQATVYDSRLSVEPGDAKDLAPKTGVPVSFYATAYCKGDLTASGISVQAGMVAADPKILPIGSIIQIDRVSPRYQGIYSVLDTGPEIQSREVDVYMWSCDEALAFGRQKVQVTVLRRGWVENGRK